MCGGTHDANDDMMKGGSSGASVKADAKLAAIGPVKAESSIRIF